MPRLTIDGRALEVDGDTTLLEAARSLGIDVPTLCTLGSRSGWASCMVCVVDDAASGRRLPACATRAQEGMAITTASAQLDGARRMAVELLLSEHLGDCEGPCRQVCPAGLDIPVMLRQVEHGRLDDALATVHRHLALPAVVSRLCPAPCERGCRRRQLERPLAIREIVRHLADRAPEPPPPAPADGAPVAVVGAGPTGLAAAFHLRRRGHPVEVFEAATEAGGHLRELVAAGELEAEVLTTEVTAIARSGVELHLGRPIVGEAWEELRRRFDAVVVAVGHDISDPAAALGLAHGDGRLEVDRSTHRTSVAGVFAGGRAVRRDQDVVRAVSHGRVIAAAAHQHLAGEPVVGEARRFNSFIGKLEEAERELLLSLHPSPLAEPPVAFTHPTAAGAEAARCLHCECLKADSCRLRQTAEIVAVDQTRFRGEDRATLSAPLEQELVVFESGKCIRCGTCVRITEEHGERLGLTFIGRGFDIRVGVPLDGTLETALERTAELCIEHCPTGALATPPEKPE